MGRAQVLGALVLLGAVACASSSGTTSDSGVSADAVGADAGPSVDATNADAASGCEADCVEVMPGVVSLSSFGGTYPRAYVLSDDSIFLGFDSGDGTDFILRTARSSSDGASWTARGNVATHAVTADRTLANSMPLQLPSGRLVSAFRHHDKPASELVYRLLVSYSDDTGASWKFLSEIETGTVNGIWEPFLFRAPDGSLHAYYAREKPGGDQDIVLRRSDDGGLSWGALITVATSAGSRDGMPSVVALADGSLLAIFESFRTAGSGTFVVRSVQSKDGGSTWPTRRDVYLPASESRHAGAPYVAVLADGRLLASFMTDEDATVTDWPNHAAVKVVASALAPSFDEVDWVGQATLVVTEAAYWPSLVRAPGGDTLVLYDQSGPKLRRLRIR